MSLKKYSYLLRTIDPVTFAEKSGDQVLYATKRYVPGSALRGALAVQYINENNLQEAHKDETFFDLFLSGKVKFLPAYPIGSKELATETPMALPLSLMRSKDGKQTIDLSGNAMVAPGFKKLQGFGVCTDKEIYKVDTEVQTEFHMSRASANERISGKSEDGNIFNYEYIKPGQYFKGYCLVDEAVDEAWRKNINKIKEVHLGRSRGAQYGKCSLEIFTDKNTELNNAVDKLYICAVTPYIPYGSVQAMAIVADELLSDLELALDNSVTFARENLSVFAALEPIDGYVGVWKTKKQRETAVCAGSLIELKLQAGNMDLAQLQLALQRGFGKNTIDGFGQFCVWQPLQGNVSEYQAGVSRQDLSEEVKARAKKVIAEMMLQDLRQEAARLAVYMESGDDYKGACKRVEGILLSCCNDISVIRNEIKRYHTAADTLKMCRLDGRSLYDLIFEKDDCRCPYVDFMAQWRPLGMSDEQIAALRKDLGANIFALNEGIMFREFWLWFMRHVVK